MENYTSEEKSVQVKSRIEKMIQEGHLSQAREVLNEYDTFLPGDPEICSMKAVITIMEGSAKEAREILISGLHYDSVHFDLLFNLAYTYELEGRNQTAADYYLKANTMALTEEQKQNVQDAIDRLKGQNPDIEAKDRPRIVFFATETMDNFLPDIIDHLSSDFWVRKILARDLKEIEAGMKWADICWFEWCNQLLVYGSSLQVAREKKIICRLHSYEAFSDFVQQVTWDSVDKVIFVAEHIRDYVLQKQPALKREKTAVVPNGIDIWKYSFRQRRPGFRIAYAGYINYKKGPMLLLHTFHALHARDHRYRLHIAGTFQDDRYSMYFDQMIKELGLEGKVFLDGWQDNLDQWLEDKNYILCTSVLESQNISVMQAMCKGIRPVVHNFVGAKKIFPDKYIWNTIEEAISMIVSEEYDSSEYRGYIAEYYSMNRQMSGINAVLLELMSDRFSMIWASSILSGMEPPEDLEIRDLTILTPCYNRSAMLIDDLDKGFNFPSQPKLFVDDCSDEANRKSLQALLEKKDRYGITDIVFRSRNGGVAEAYNTGVHAIGTRYIMARGDDDILLARKSADDLDDLVPRVGTEYAMIAPRFLINYMTNSRLGIGYDNKSFDGLYAHELLRHLFLTGELFAVNAGAIYLREDMLQCLPEPVFRVSEDYTLTSRVLGMRTNARIKVTEALTYVRRITGTSLSRVISEEKLSLNLFSMMVSGYYCLRSKLINQSTFMDTFIKREELLHKWFNYRKGMAEIIIGYSFGNKEMDVFLSGMKNRGLNLEKPEDLPKEILSLPELLK